MTTIDVLPTPAAVGDTVAYQLISAEDLPATVQRFIDDGGPVGLDIEATGIDPWTTRLIMIQVGDERGHGGSLPVAIVDVRHLDENDWVHVREAVRLLFSGRVELQGHNLKYDCLTLAVRLGITPDDLRPLWLYDTMLAEQVILGGVDAPDGSGRERANLAATAARYGIAVTKDPRSWFVGLDQPDRQAEWDAPLPDVQLDYAACDVALLSAVRAGQAGEIAAKGLADTVALEMACAPAVIAMELAGIAVDVPGWQCYLDGVRETADALEAQIQAGLAPTYITECRRGQQQETARLTAWQAGKEAVIATARANWDALASDARPMWGDVRNQAIRQYTDQVPRPRTPAPLPSRLNLDSPAQLLAALRLSGVVLVDTAAETLEGEARRRPDVPALALLCRWRKLNKLLTAFGEKVLSRMQPDGRLHPSWRQIGSEDGQVSTGRMSCALPNLQQLPAHDEQDGDSIRQHIVASPGAVLVIADFSNIEARVVAERSQDPALLDLFRQGGDLHTLTAIQMFGLPADTTEADARRLEYRPGIALRSAAKTINYALLFGAGPGRLSAMLGCSLEDARDLLTRYFDTYPAVKRYLDGAANEALARGYTCTIGGRRRNFLPAPKPDRDQFLSWDGYRAALEAYRITESKVRRQAANAGIQGTAADVMKLALTLTFRRLSAEAPGARIVAAVHDEILIEAPEGCTDAAARVLENAMSQAARSYLPTVAIGELKAVQAPYWQKE